MERIELDPKVCNGRPVIRGTRIPIAVIIGQLAEGESWQAVLDGYPELSREDIHAALSYAKAAVEHVELESIDA